MRNARAAFDVPRPGRRGLALIAGLALGAGGVAACGKDSPEKLSVTLTPDGKLTGVKELSGGPVELKFRNSGKAPYDVGIARIDGNHTVDEALKVIAREGGPIPDWLHGAGGVGTVAPGRTGTATQVLGPGNYFLSAEMQDSDAKPITATLKVSGGKSEGDLPDTDAKITATEYTFTTSGLKAGNNKVEFDNVGRQLHHAVVLPLAPGKTLADVRKFLQAPGMPQGQPPFDVMKGANTAVIDGGTKMTTELNLQKGRNVMLCFIQDRAGGPPHVAKGMVKEVNVP